MLFPCHFDGEERAGCFTFIVFLMSCDCYCCSPIPHGAVSRSAVCNAAFPGNTMYALYFLCKMHALNRYAKVRV